MLHAPSDSRTNLRIRSIVGLIPLFAAEVPNDELLAAVLRFVARATWLLTHHLHLAALVSQWQKPG